MLLVRDVGMVCLFVSLNVGCRLLLFVCCVIVSCWFVVVCCLMCVV